MTVTDLEIIANQCEVPLLLEILETQFPEIEITCFESDKYKVGSYLYSKLPATTKQTIYTVPNQIEYYNKTQQFLIEHKELKEPTG